MVTTNHRSEAAALQHQHPWKATASLPLIARAVTGAKFRRTRIVITGSLSSTGSSSLTLWLFCQVIASTLKHPSLFLVAILICLSYLKLESPRTTLGSDAFNTGIATIPRHSLIYVVVKSSTTVSPEPPTYMISTSIETQPRVFYMNLTSAVC